jgi:CHASE2 domain-containing sensor protein
VRLSRNLALALAAAAALAIGVTTLATDALSRLEGDTVGMRFAARGSEPADDIAVVAVDERTFSELDRQWPFPRAMHARLIDRLRRDGARVIVYDVQFTEPTDPADDLALYESVGRAGDLVLATTEVDSSGHTNVLGGDANLRRVGAVAGASNLPVDSGGVIRHYPENLLGLPSLAVAAARFGGHPVPPRRFHDGRAWIDFRGPPHAIDTYSYSDVLSGRVDPRLLAGRIVVVGASAPTLQDVHQTSTAASHLMSGPEIQANAIWTAMHDNPLQSAPGWLALIAVVLAAMLAPLATLRLRPLTTTLAALAAAALYLVAAQVAFEHGVILVVVYPLLALLAGLVGMIAASYVLAFIERNQFSRQLRASQLELIQRLAQAVEYRDAETGGHIRRIGTLCERLARSIGWSERDAEMLRHASAMHDVGKIGIPDTILLKPGRLDEDEWRVVRSHTTIGAEILADSANPLVQMAERIALHHHERWDGTGYPAGIAGEEIPIEARICSVCDVFDALLSQRSYKDSWRLEDALAEIARNRGTQFDPVLVDRFLELAPEMLGELDGSGAHEAPSYAPSPRFRVA